LPTGCKKFKKRDGENENIMQKRNRNILTLRKALYQILGRAAPLTFSFTGAIEKVMKIYQK